MYEDISGIDEGAVLGNGVSAEGGRDGEISVRDGVRADGVRKSGNRISKRVKGQVFILKAGNDIK